MTYCVGLLVRNGLVMLTDSRTNAGVDHVSTFRKLTVWERKGERTIALATAGNLAITQAAVNLLNEGVGGKEDGEQPTTIMQVKSMREAAQLAGKALRQVFAIDGEALRQAGTEFTASLLLGGQVNGGEMRLFYVYAAGNYIQSTEETPFFQIGETKYGKPILDRLVSFDTTVQDAAKLALISMDSTVRSNLSVGLPLDLLIVRRGALEVAHRVPIDEKNPYYRVVHSRWSRALRSAFERLPDVPWT